MAGPVLTPFMLRVSLQGMRPEDTLQVALSPEYATLRLEELLTSVFPECARHRSQLEERFDLGFSSFHLPENGFRESEVSPARVAPFCS